MLQKHRWRDERRVLNIAIKLHHYDNNMMMYLQEGWVGQWCMGRLVTSNWSAHLIVDPISSSGNMVVTFRSDSDTASTGFLAVACCDLTVTTTG